MDIERTLQQLLESHSRAIERMDRADARADRAEKRMDRIDKQLQSTANLVRGGMKLIVEDRKRHRKELAELGGSIAHRLLEQLRREGANGRH